VPEPVRHDLDVDAGGQRDARVGGAGGRVAEWAAGRPSSRELGSAASRIQAVAAGGPRGRTRDLGNGSPAPGRSLGVLAPLVLAQEVNGEDVDRDQADAAVRPPPAIFGLVPPPRRACADDWAQLGQSGKATSTRPGGPGTPFPSGTAKCEDHELRLEYPSLTRTAACLHSCHGWRATTLRPRPRATRRQRLGWPLGCRRTGR
jgi:hypothetical protein